MRKKFAGSLAMVLLAILAAANYCLFVFPYRFAPAGIDGICTMIQDIFQINMGYLALFLNIPLVVLAFLFLSRDFAIKSTVFVISFSLAVIFLKGLDLPLLFAAGAEGAGLFPPIAAGIARGLLYAATLKLNGSAGGIDIISALIKHKKPHLNLMGIIFLTNMVIAGCSFFVYGMHLEPVICSIIYAFITSTVCNKLRRTGDDTVKFEIITRNAEQLCRDIIGQLHLKATVLDAHSGRTGNDTRMVVCVVKKKDVPYLEELILSREDCITFKSSVSDTLVGITYL